MSKLKPFVALTRKPLILSRISIIFSFIFFDCFSDCFYDCFDHHLLFSVKIYWGSILSHGFGRYISKKNLFVRDINWITPRAAKSLFVWKLSHWNPSLNQRPELYLYKFNHASLSHLTRYIFEEKQTKLIRTESTLKQRKIVSYLKLIDFWKKISSNLF